MPLPRYRERELLSGFSFISSLHTLRPLLFPRIEWATLFIVATLLASVGNEFINYYTGMIVGKFYMLLTDKEEHAFWKTFWKASGMYAGQCLILAVVTFFSWCLYLAFRRNLTHKLHKIYFANKIYYKLNVIDNDGLDNPDQRMTQDVEKFCRLLATKVLPGAMIAPFVVGYYTWKTWHTAGPVGVGVIYGYFVLGSIINAIIVQPITKWAAKVEKAEGDYRYKHVSIRDNAESTAFYKAEPFEKSESNRIFWELFVRQRNYVIANLPINFFQNFFDYYGGVLSYAVNVIPIFWLHSYDKYDAGTFAMKISNNSFVFIYLINSFTRLTDLAASVGEMAVYSQRIAALVTYAKDKEAEGYSYDNPLENGDYKERPKEDGVLALRGVTYSSPVSEQALIEDLSVQLKFDQTLLISGRSGVGKSSLQRVLAKLWKKQKGTITLPLPDSHIFFLPQRPYLPTGGLSLKQQILFPLVSDQQYICELDDSRILRLLDCLSLTYLIGMSGGLHENVDFEWADRLTPGECQRLSICRVLYHQPALVIMDEATNSMGEDAEAVVYQLLKEHKIRYISTGHQTSLRRYHDIELVLGGQKNNEFRDINYQQL